MSDIQLRAAAEEGNINSLYTAIQTAPNVLEYIDSIPFVQTPLHIAASMGHLQFATEIMRLKPSFAWKLNPQGFTPIHLALQQGQSTMVLRLVDINKDLIRAKGREGITPLHFVSQVGDVDLLVDFLLLCSDSIRDVTVRSETALHIAFKYQQYEALHVLIGWLKIAPHTKVEKTILSWKDQKGNTILHISALENNSQVVRWLVQTNIDLEAKNLENKTSSDIAASEEIKSIIERAKGKRGSPVTNIPTFADKLKSNITMVDKINHIIWRTRRHITEDQRNAFLIAATLVATATYQSALSPPGGVYQSDAEENNNANNTSLTFMGFTLPRKTGRSVMPGGNFLLLFSANTLSFLASITTIFVLVPRGKLRRILSAPMVWFINSYLYSMSVISPNIACVAVCYMLLILLDFLLGIGYCLFPMMYRRLWDPAKRKTEIRNVEWGNIW
ncbi:hypothetical protein Fmac_021038 [Flemingia macrophylla]|uniref:PGG domain-containing protein n=1 Tax=Flemingia macrophylla TaxID=520843 RepID=A0ABD1LVR5_9FABA